MATANDFCGNAVFQRCQGAFLSKPMIADVAALQAQVGGVTDPKAIEQQSQMASEMVSGMAVGTPLAQSVM